MERVTPILARYGVKILLLAFAGALAPATSAAQSVGTAGLAHPRRIRSFIGAFHEAQAPVETQLVKMGLGDALFLVGGQTNGTEYRLEIEAGVAAEFDLAVSSFDFLSAAFLVGVPLTVRRGGLEAGVRLYHQSSHLGDDILTRRDVVVDSVQAYDFEAVDLFVGRGTGRLRPYAGFEYRFRRTPDRQDPSVVHVGAAFLGRGRTKVVGGVHGWWAENSGGELGVQARFGIEVGRSGPGRRDRRPVRILLDGTWGAPDAGRFFRSVRQTFGLTVELAR